MFVLLEATQAVHLEGAMNTRVERIRLTVTLLLLGGADAAVLFFVADRQLRFILGVLLLAPIVLVSSQLGVAEYFRSLVKPTIRDRRYIQMRTLVDRLLEEIRRLNATAVDGRRGVRDSSKTVEMLDSIESGLGDLIGRIRLAAGEEQTATHDGPSEEPDPPASSS